MKTIVFFDTWLSGLRQIDEIAKYLYKDYKIIFLSIDQLSNKYLSKELEKKNLSTFAKRSVNNLYYYKITDVSNYNNSIKQFFEKEKPDLAITISLHNLDHRWFNIICQHFKTPVFLIMHGIKGDSVFTNKRRKLPSINLIKRFIFYNKLYYLYLNDKKQVKIESTNTFSEWIQLIFHRNNYKFAPNDCYNVKYNKLFVTTESDIAFFKFQYPTLQDSSFYIIGTLDLISFYEEYKYSDSKTKEYVLFLGQPLEPILSRKAYKNFIIQVSQFCSTYNLKLLFRPHPREKDEIIAFVKNNKIEMSSNSLMHDLSLSIFTIGFNSTALLTSISLNIPIVSFRLEDIPHPKFLNESDLSVVLNNIKDFNPTVIELIKKKIVQNIKKQTINPIEIIKMEISNQFNK